MKQAAPALHESPAIQTANELNKKIKTDITFDVGERVIHEEYGEGVIEKIGGTGHKSIGTVRFEGADRTRRFVLTHGALKKI